MPHTTYTEIPHLNLHTRGFSELGDDTYNSAVLEAAEALGICDLEEYEAGDGWHWRFRAPENGQILAAASEGLHDREECRENFRRTHRRLGATRALRWTQVEK